MVIGPNESRRIPVEIPEGAGSNPWVEARLEWTCTGCKLDYTKKILARPDPDGKINVLFWCPRCTPLYRRAMNRVRELLSL